MIPGRTWFFVLPLVGALACGSSSSSGSGTGGTDAGGAGGSNSGGAAGADGGLDPGICESYGGGEGAGGPCDSDAGSGCEPGNFCQFAPGTCGDPSQGVCRRPDFCKGACAPTCGCDGKSYSSRCAAEVAGTAPAESLSCVLGNGTAGDNCAVDGDCQGGFKCCASCGAVGCPIACIAAQGSCPAFP